MKTFRVESYDWKDEVDVDDELFETYESQAQEAVSLSLERWLKEDDMNLAIGVFTTARDIDDEPRGDNTFVMNTKFAFVNIGRLDMVRMMPI